MHLETNGLMKCIHGELHMDGLCHNDEVCAQRIVGLWLWKGCVCATWRDNQGIRARLSRVERVGFTAGTWLF